jgi:hypothetical protein
VTQMRFLNKRPKIDEVRDELNTVMEVMESDYFVVLDLLLFSIIFTLLLSPSIQSLKLSVLIFCGNFGIFTGLYFFIVNRFFKNKIYF